MDKAVLLTLTAEIVSAHVSNNAVGGEGVPQLITSVYTALASAGEQASPAGSKRMPAVAIRSSVKANAVICLECGVQKKMLKRHLSTDHNLSPEQYRARWELGRDYPLVAPGYSARRSAIAQQLRRERRGDGENGRSDQAAD